MTASSSVQPPTHPTDASAPTASTNGVPVVTPPMTVVVKRRVLGASSRLGILDGVRDSKWRQHRLLILCYHSVSMDDEHEWSGIVLVLALLALAGVLVMLFT